MCELKQHKALETLNHDIYALTFGDRQIPPQAWIMSKKKKRLNNLTAKSILAGEKLVATYLIST
jgi:hypothetical protein